MTHDEIVAEIQLRAKRSGILSEYCGRALRCQGDRGKPDLFLVGMFGAAWIEVKTPGDQLRAEQVTWKHMLRSAGQVHEVMGERDLAAGGAFDMLLSFVAEGSAAA